MTLNPHGPLTRDGLRRALRAGTGALALALLAAGCAGGGDATPTASGAATVGAIAAPTVSSSAPVDVSPPLTPYKDFFPVPQADAADIPWDDVGPGWFLVDSRVRANHDSLDPGEIARMPEAVGGLSLVSPTGRWYAARSFAGSGAAFSLHWAADGVWLMTSADEGIEEVVGDIVRVDLKTGEQVSVATRQVEDFAYAGAADGVTLVAGYSQEAATDYLVYGLGGVAQTACALHTVFGIRSLISPDGTRVSCWGFRSDNKTDVGVLDLRTPAAIGHLDVFSRDVYSYQTLGWDSDGTFLLARLNAEGNQEAFFAYDVSTRKIADMPLPFTLDAGNRVEAFDYVSQVYISSDEGGGSIAVYRKSGEMVATVAGGCADGGAPRWTLSGESLLTFCQWQAGAVTLIDLETGEAIGTWPHGPDLEVRAYGYPEHAD